MWYLGPFSFYNRKYNASMRTCRFLAHVQCPFHLMDVFFYFLFIFLFEAWLVAGFNIEIKKVKLWDNL